MENGVLTGQYLDHYQVLEQLGTGGMATVYKAYDTRQGSIAAIKVILARIADSPQYLRRFELEARVLSQLHHPNIVGIMDYGKDKGLPYLVMPYISGGTLKERITPGPMDYRMAASILAPIAWGLDYAHQHNVIHRDVKPSNILFTEAGRPMLTDFGIAKLAGLDHTLDLTETGLAFGSVEYMSPEQALNRKIDFRVDVYALGIVLYELVTGKRPFHGESPAVVLHMQAYDPPPDPRRLAHGLPDVFAQVILQALAKNPDERFATMRVFAELLDHYGRLEADRAGQSLPGEERRVEPTLPVPGGLEANPDSLMEHTRPVSGEHFEFSPPWPEEVPSIEAAIPSGPQVLPVPEPTPTAQRRMGIWLAAAGMFLLLCLVGVSLMRGLANQTGGGIPAPFQGSPTSTQSESQPAGSEPLDTPGDVQASPVPSGLPSGQTDIPPTTGDPGWQQGRLAFLLREGSASRIMLYLLSPLTNPEVIYDPGGRLLLLGLAWSPDGNQIGFYTAGGGLQVLDANGDRQVRGIGACNSPSWSPNGRRILCKASQKPTFQIYDAQDGQLIDEFGTSGGLVPAWSPDGRSIVYATLSNGRSRLWLAPYEGPAPSGADTASGIRALTNPQVLAGEAAENYAPAWSPDGSQIAYQSGTGDGASEIWVMNRDGSNAHPVTDTPDPAWSRAPAWSPDGRWLAYVSSRNGSYGTDYGEVFVVNLTSLQTYQLTGTGGRVYDWRIGWAK